MKRFHGVSSGSYSNCYANATKAPKLLSYGPRMKFGQVALLVLLVFVQASAFTQDCPLDNAFLSSQKVGTINPSRMETLAGLAASRVTSGVLWAHDAGQINRIFALSTTGRAIDDY